MAGLVEIDIEISTARLGNQRLPARAKELRPGVLAVELPRVTGQPIMLEPYESVIVWRGGELIEGETLAVEGGTAEVELHERIGPQRRMYFRLAVSLPIRVTVPPGVQTSTETLTLDIGGGGVGFRWPVPLERGAQLHVELSIGSDTIHSDVTVAFSRPTHGGHHVGVEFVKIQDKDRTKIVHYVNAEQLREHGSG